MTVYLNGKPWSKPEEKIARTDCIECGTALYYSPSSVTPCMPRGDAFIYRMTGHNHFIIVLNGLTTASCLIWPNLDISIANMEKLNDNNSVNE